MAPILIDNRGLIKLGLISALSAVIVFAAGFFSGYQQATTFYATGSEIETLALPVQAVLLESDVEPQLPDTIVAGAEIDVDQPQVESKANTKNSAVESKPSISSKKEKVNKTKTSETPVSTKLVSLEQASKPNNKVSSDDKNIASKNNQFSLKEAVTSNSFQNESGKSVATKEPDLIVVASLTPAELNSIKYSIQVGIYGRLINAENMMMMLQAQHLDAYVSDYTNKKNENRYNVRFGYFVDKKSALSALKKYKNKQKGDGYLVNFSVENITKLADAMDLKQSTTTKETEKKPSPATAPLDTTGDKVSQTDVVSASTVLAGAQSQAVVEILPDIRVKAITK